MSSFTGMAFEPGGAALAGPPLEVTDVSLEAGEGVGAEVLVVEDTASVGEALRRVLRARGYTVVVCPDAGRAVDHLRGTAGSPAGRAPAAVLVDVHLPDGSGLEVARVAREVLGDGVPVVVLSGDTSMQILRSLPETGATLFIAKPVHTPTLLARLAELIRLPA